MDIMRFERPIETTFAAARAIAQMGHVQAQEYPLVVVDYQDPSYTRGTPGFIQFYATAVVAQALAASTGGHLLSGGAAPTGDVLYTLQVPLLRNFDEVLASVNRLALGTPGVTAMQVVSDLRARRQARHYDDEDVEPVIGWYITDRMLAMIGGTALLVLLFMLAIIF